MWPFGEGNESYAAPSFQKIEDQGFSLALEFIKDIYRHCKPILAIDAAALLETAADTKLPSGEPDPGIILVDKLDKLNDGVLSRFATAVANHRALERYADPPGI